MAVDLHLVAPLTVDTLQRYSSQVFGPVVCKTDWLLGSQDSAGWEEPCSVAVVGRSMRLAAPETAAAVPRVSFAPVAAFEIAGAVFAHRYLKSCRWRSAGEA